MLLQNASAGTLFNFSPSETTRKVLKSKLSPCRSPDPQVQGGCPTLVLPSPLACHPHQRLGSVACLASLPPGPHLCTSVKTSFCPESFLFLCNQNETCSVPGRRRHPLLPGFLQLPLTSQSWNLSFIRERCRTTAPHCCPVVSAVAIVFLKLAYKFLEGQDRMNPFPLHDPFFPFLPPFLPFIKWRVSQ